MRIEKKRTIELQKKVHRKIWVRDITFLTARPPSYVTFCRFFSSLLSLSSALNFLGKNIFAPEGRSLPPLVSTAFAK